MGRWMLNWLSYRFWLVLPTRTQVLIHNWIESRLLSEHVKIVHKVSQVLRLGDIDSWISSCVHFCCYLLGCRFSVLTYLFFWLSGGLWLPMSAKSTVWLVSTTCSSASGASRSTLSNILRFLWVLRIFLWFIVDLRASDYRGWIYFRRSN